MGSKPAWVLERIPQKKIPKKLKETGYFKLSETVDELKNGKIKPTTKQK
jgi:hypothetical protein